jgi:hypothetical protein
MANADGDAGEQQPSRDYHALSQMLTAERLGSYLRWSGGDPPVAFALYAWNMTASAAVMHTTGIVEVVVPNAMDRALHEMGQARGWSSWFDRAPFSVGEPTSGRPASAPPGSGVSRRSTGRSSPSCRWAIGGPLVVTLHDPSACCSRLTETASMPLPIDPASCTEWWARRRVTASVCGYSLPSG